MNKCWFTVLKITTNIWIKYDIPNQSTFSWLLLRGLSLLFYHLFFSVTEVWGHVHLPPGWCGQAVLPLPETGGLRAGWDLHCGLPLCLHHVYVCLHTLHVLPQVFINVFLHIFSQIRQNTWDIHLEFIYIMFITIVCETLCFQTQIVNFDKLYNMTGYITMVECWMCIGVSTVMRTTSSCPMTLRYPIRSWITLWRNRRNGEARKERGESLQSMTIYGRRKM